ncbi:hypothetical protein AB0D04_33345 [Streptomyces sp. NPDC048483]|uniref:hypothetical protein n=1 Tax=Streptomyces sp. NPDC048483 TaxID=3154927 RepID=UPI0034153111
MSDHTGPSVEALVETLQAGRRDEYRAAVEQLTALGPVAVGPLLASCARGSMEAQGVFHCLSRMGELSRVGEPVTAALHDIRRHGPGRLRRHALQALAELGGANALSPEDRLAVPADRVSGAVKALGLCDVRPATLAMGVSAAYSHHEDSITYRTPGGKRETACRIFS